MAEKDGKKKRNLKKGKKAPAVKPGDASDDDEDFSIIRGIDSEFVGHGLAFGKFMPPTNGHLYFLNFARESCRKLTIIVCSLPEEPIPGEIRYNWIKEMFPDCNVVHHYIDIKQEPDHPEDWDFFNLWKDSIEKHCPGEKFDALFASEPYGYKMARVMDMKFIPVDVRRELVQISGTEMRKNPLKHWDHLHPVVRPYFLKRIALVGPDGSGKTSLARDLAEHFETLYASEYGKTMNDDYSANMPGFDASERTIRDVSTIARGQMASEASVARQANKLLFCDTEILTIKNRAEERFGDCPEWVEKAAKDKTYDLYMLLDPRGVDAQLTEEEKKNLPPLEDRVREFENWKKELSVLGRDFVVVDGNDWEARYRKAVIKVQEHIPELIETPKSQFSRKATRNGPAP